MIEATQDKLEESRFFLRHLRREADRAANLGEGSGAAFGHFLSAFVSAARSVPWVLHAEEKEKYDAWIERWNVTRSPRTRSF
jgi:hypothetical protein